MIYLSENIKFILYGFIQNKNIYALYQLYINYQIIHIGLRGSAKLVTYNYSLNVYLGNSCIDNKLKLHFLHIF